MLMAQIIQLLLYFHFDHDIFCFKFDKIMFVEFFAHLKLLKIIKFAT